MKLVALAFKFKLAGQRDVTKVFMVWQAMQGYLKGRSIADSRCPISFSVLSAVVGQLVGVCTSKHEVTLLAIFVLAFFGAFRVGELVSQNKRGNGGLGV